MTDNTNHQDLIALLRTFIGDTQIVRAAREAADVIEKLVSELETAKQYARNQLTQQEIDLDAAKARIAELEARSATPYCHIYEYDHGYFGLHRQFSPTEWNGMKPTRVVAVFTAPVADSAMAKDAEEPSLQALYEDACIAANKNAKDAERYRWLHERYIGFDFGWNADENGDNGKQVLCFEMDNGMRISADIDASIDAQIAASEPKNTGN